MSYLEQLAKAVMEGRVYVDPMRIHPDADPYLYRISVEPDTEAEAIESILKSAS